MKMMKQQKQLYLHPTVKVVCFRVEEGFAFSNGNEESFEIVTANDDNTTLTGSGNFGGSSTNGGDNNGGESMFGNIF